MHLLAETITVPAWLLGAPGLVVGAAAVLTAVGVIGRTLYRWTGKAAHATTMLQLIVHELTPNSGGSVKDKVNQAADDSREALDLTRTLKEEQGEDRQRLCRVEEKVETYGRTAGELENWLARCMIHIVRGDLSDSRLMREVKARLSPEEFAEFKAEGERLRAEREKRDPATDGVHKS